MFGDLKRYILEPGPRSWSSSSQVWRGNFAGCWRSQVKNQTHYSPLLPPFFFFQTCKFPCLMLLGFTDHLKSREEQQREKKLLQRLMEIVDGRNAIVDVLDEDRLRWATSMQRTMQRISYNGHPRQWEFGFISGKWRRISSWIKWCRILVSI